MKLLTFHEWFGDRIDVYDGTVVLNKSEFELIQSKAMRYAAEFYVPDGNPEVFRDRILGEARKIER